jgi:hypothetical protein
MPDKKLFEKCFVHDLDALAHHAKLEGAIGKTASVDPDFNTYWATVKDWNESSRYTIWTEKRARDMFRAVTDANHGVLPWIKQHW